MTETARVAGVVLAAGFSRRLGRPKQTVVLAGQTLVERAARTAGEAGLHPLIVVMNAAVYASEAETLRSFGGTPMVNVEAGEGMASSIRLGVTALLGPAGVLPAGAVVMTCDQVAVTAEHLRALYAELGEAAGSGYAGKVGVPAYFPASCFGKLLALRGDAGARELLQEVRCVATEALALDVDTEEDLARAEAWLRAHGR